MTFITSYLPAIGAIFLLLVSTLQAQDRDLNTTAGAQKSAAPLSVGQTNYERDLQSTFSVAGKISYAAVPGVHGYAMFSGAEIGLFKGQSAWITSHRRRAMPDRDSIADGLNVRPIPRIAQAIPVTGHNGRMRIAFQDTSVTDGTVPVPIGIMPSVLKTQPQGAETSDEKLSKIVERKHGRIVLTRELSDRGWNESPVK